MHLPFLLVDVVHVDIYFPSAPNRTRATGEKESKDENEMCLTNFFFFQCDVIKQVEFVWQGFSLSTK